MRYRDGDCPETDDEMYAIMSKSTLMRKIEKYQEALEIIAGYDYDQFHSASTLLGNAVRVAKSALKESDGSWRIR